jgi:hypothetical protein
VAEFLVILGALSGVLFAVVVLIFFGGPLVNALAVVWEAKLDRAAEEERQRRKEAEVAVEALRVENAALRERLGDE